MRRKPDAKNESCGADDRNSQDQSKNTTQQTLISAIEQIINLAIEMKLDQSFYEKAYSALTYLSERMSLNEKEALLFALFIENSTRSRIQLDDLAEMIGCRNIRVIAMLTNADALVERRLVRKFKSNGEIFYRVPQDVLAAVKENRTYQPVTFDHLTAEQLFDTMDNIFNNTEADDCYLLDDLDALIAANPQLKFCQAIKSYNLQVLNIERLLLYIFCHRFINLDDDMIGTHDWEDFFTRADIRFISRHMKDRTFLLAKLNIIENCNSDGMNDSQYFHLSNKAKEELFADLNHISQQTKSKKDLITSSSFAPKELFYNASVQRQIDRLGELLSPEHFDCIRQRLESNGLRKGFACLFYGAPGTGKTETVYQLARRTGRDLMIVDVSQIKSCWVGESEKNIKAAFDRYRSYVKQSELAPIMLFNEADAILGIRQEGAQRAVEKMENSLQNIILQEMEQLDGIMIATTNLSQNMDKAFERRFLYKIEFEKPSTEAKSLIWRSMIPTLDEQRAFTLAERYDFSGGQIENIARKRTIDMILCGTEPSFEQLDEYCRVEMLDKEATPQRRKIGF